MAMTKREQAEMDALRVELSEAKALRFSGIPEPERMPLPDAGYVNGWDFNVHGAGISEAWTERYNHSRIGHRTDDGDRWASGRLISSSQGGCRLYATRLDALIGLRLAEERECAKALAALDQRIEAERGSAQVPA